MTPPSLLSYPFQPESKPSRFILVILYIRLNRFAAFLSIRNGFVTFSILLMEILGITSCYPKNISTKSAPDFLFFYDIQKIPRLPLPPHQRFFFRTEIQHLPLA